MRTRSKPDPVNPDLVAVDKVLRLEAEGIRVLAESMDGRVSEALDILAGVTGHVVVTGMGKSGHVARKIAATMSSVGTPALYVHPGEASHGDLGMITGNDAVLALSNSGETSELSDIVAFTRRFTIPLISITGGGENTLSGEADVALMLPPSPEACPLGLAPTTSTTMMLALGDALAVGLLERKGFSADDFQVLHPGGRLGQKLIRVTAIMHSGDEVPLVSPGTPMSEALIVMTAKRFGCVGVADGDGRLLGVVTDGDLRRHMGAELVALRVERVMTKEPKTIRSQALAAEALGLMNSSAITSLFVIEDGVPVGILHIHDCLRAGVA
jgi:arabinose-5-phosphate isomerase